MIHPILIAALLTIIAHHMQNPALEPPSPIEFRICQQLIIDLDIMVDAGGNPDFAEKRTLCKRSLSAYEARFRAHTIGGIPRITAVTS